MVYGPLSKLVPTLCVSIVILAACVAKGPAIVPLHPQQISCVDQSIPEMLRNVQRAFGKYEGASKSLDSNAYEEQARNDLLQQSKYLAQKGNPYAMGFYADMERDRLITSYLIKQNILTPKEAISARLPDDMKTDMVNALSYMYVASGIPGSHQERTREVIERIHNPHSVDNPILSDYVHIPFPWLAESKAHAERWREYCGKE